MLLAALWLPCSLAHAQLTGGRAGGSNWGSAAPSAPSPSPAVVPSRPPPPAQRVLIHQWRRGAASPGQQVVAAQERVADEDERRAASPPWSAGTVSGPPRYGLGAVAGALTFGLLFGITLLLTRRRPRAPAATPAAQHPGVELRLVSVAFDWSVRAQLQRELAALAARISATTPQGLHALATSARDLLITAHRAARFGVFQSFATDLGRAQPLFNQLADRARARYTVETVNNAHRILGPAVDARAEEGAGLVVVSLLIASRGPLPQLPTTLDGPALMRALQECVPARADRLLAAEIVWSPASERDRMSSAELAVLYPELLPLGGAGALGRRACGHCRAVYAAELGVCPACGAG